ncbi:MAG: lecithin retinol acyltransferase family protein [Myxococcota bacterium]|nr:lecithin retinol acyltransferase family protein [Myxococcota bacterium]
MTQRFPVPGDHLVSPRGLYSHHGLYVGDGRVIHYAGKSDATTKDGPIVETSLVDFCKGHGYSIQHHAHRRYSHAESVHRARSRLGENAYALWSNNCEHFVNWCIEGAHDSAQVNTAVPIGVAGGTAAGVVAAFPTATFVGTVAGAKAAGAAAAMKGFATIGAAVGGGAAAGVGVSVLAPAAGGLYLLHKKLLPDDPNLDASEREARRAGRTAGTTAAAVATTAVGAVIVGGAKGAGAAAITSGLAALGGGSMVLGAGLAVAGPLAAALGVGWLVYKLFDEF